jgi:hypothetical protein
MEITEEKPKQVSCYLNEQIKLALEKESNQFKSIDSSGPRSSINKNAIFIFEDFMKKFDKNIKGIEKLIEQSFNIKIKNINQKEFEKILSVDYIQYPLKLTNSFKKRLDEFRVRCNDTLGFNLGKRSFYNFILLTYYIQNRIEIAKKEIDFWSQNHFEKGSKTDFDDVLDMFNKMITA